jgi:hypothetical protein
MDPTVTGRWPAVDQRILQTSMIPLAVVVLDELAHRSPEMPFAQRNHPVERLLLYRPHKSLRVRIRVRGLIGRLHAPNPRLAEPLAHGRAPLRIPIADHTPEMTGSSASGHQRNPDRLTRAGSGRQETGGGGSGRLMRHIATTITTTTMRMVSHVMLTSH